MEMLVAILAFGLLTILVIGKLVALIVFIWAAYEVISDSRRRQ